MTPANSSQHEKPNTPNSNTPQAGPSRQNRVPDESTPRPISSESQSLDSWYTESSSSEHNSISPTRDIPSDTQFPKIEPRGTALRYHPIFPRGTAINVEVPEVGRSETQRYYFQPSSCQVADPRSRVPIYFRWDGDWSLERWAKFTGAAPPEPGTVPNAIVGPDAKVRQIHEERYQEECRQIRPPERTGTAAWDKQMKITLERFFAPLATEDEDIEAEAEGIAADPEVQGVEAEEGDIEAEAQDNP